MLVRNPRSSCNAAAVDEPCLQRVADVIWYDPYGEVRALVPAEGEGADAQHHFLRFGGIAEWSFFPAVSLTQDFRCHAQAGHRGVRCQSDERASSFARGAREPHRL